MQMTFIQENSYVTIKDDIEQPTYEWDGKTVEDGRYEIRVTASDIRSNTPETKLTNSRISDQLVVDNTPPQISNILIKTENKKDRKKASMYDRDKPRPIIETVTPRQATINKSRRFLNTSLR